MINGSTLPRQTLIAESTSIGSVDVRTQGMKQRSIAMKNIQTQNRKIIEAARPRQGLDTHAKHGTCKHLTQIIMLIQQEQV